MSAGTGAGAPKVSSRSMSLGKAARVNGDEDCGGKSMPASRRAPGFGTRLVLPPRTEAGGLLTASVGIRPLREEGGDIVTRVEHDMDEA